MLFHKGGIILFEMGNDRFFLEQAIRIAADGIKEGGGPFGAVITRRGRIIAGSNNRVVLSHDPTAHAEMIVIRKASELLKNHDLSGCTLYTSCEPCPMCLGAVYWAGIRKVVYASDRIDAANAGFSDKFIYDEIILNPSSRKIKFIRSEDCNGDIVFRKWNEFEDKIAY